jgi:hypothetical protein
MRIATALSATTFNIIIGTGVVVEPGAIVTFKAPLVKGQDGFHAPNSATVYIRQ